jgi:D-sedoheptulose 7-phosphate isomerase
MIGIIKSEIQASITTKQALLENANILSLISDIANACVTSLKSGGKIILAGNGGSFADAQHISAEFTSRYMVDRESLPSICLGTNNSSISAIGNDYGYDEVFARELSSIGNGNDLFIAISTSGNSKNIVKAIKKANEKKILTYAFTGENGGMINELCPCLKIPSKETGRIQESHILIGHIICSLTEKEFFK